MTEAEILDNIRIGFEAEFVIFDDEDRLQLHSKFSHESDDIPASYRVRRILAEELSEYVGEKVIAPNRVSQKIRRDWAIVPEEDIEHCQYGDNAVGAIEIISPPLTIDDAKRQLKNVFEYADDYTLEQFSNCGLHINISCPSINRENGRNILLALDEERILLDWGRDTMEMGLYKHDLISNVVSRMLIDPFFELVESNSRDFVPFGDKGYFINAEKLFLEDPYLEFRHMGNANFTEINRIFRTIDYYIDAIITALYKNKFNEILTNYSNQVKEVKNVYESEKPRLVFGEKTKIGGREITILNNKNKNLGTFSMISNEHNIKVYLGDPEKLIFSRKYNPESEQKELPITICMSPIGTMETAAIRCCMLKYFHDEFIKGKKDG